MVGNAMVEEELDLGTEVEILAVEEAEAVVVDLIPWLATGVGCMAIWPVTIPLLVARQQVVAMLAPLVEYRQNSGVQVQVGREVVDGTFDLVGLMFCMIPKGKNTQ